MLDPLPASRWNFETAAHLINRAGFGAAPSEIERLAGLGLSQAVASLLQVYPDATPKPDWAVPDPNRMQELAAFKNGTEEEKKMARRARAQVEIQHGLSLRDWWLQRMMHTPNPLIEKMTLFWHGHFATSVQKVKDVYLMWMQNEVFRRNATGNWETMLLETSKDPAMLIWLDNAHSKAGNPNENFAREVMELFALGEGHYAEQDIKEAARAYTGWSYNPINQQFVYRPRLHDAGTKTVFGVTGPLTGEEVIHQIAQQPQSARFLGAKIWTYFSGQTASPELIEALAGIFQNAGGQFKPFLQTLFQSSEFYAPDVLRAEVKSPVQWLVSTCKTLERDLPPPLVCNNILRSLGQELFAPPNVKGWDGGLTWITTNNLLNRYNYSALLVEGVNPFKPGAPKTAGSPPEMMTENDLGNPEKRRDAILNALTPRTIPAANAAILAPAPDRTSDELLLASLEKRFFQSRLKDQRRATLKEVLAGKSTPYDDTAVLHLTRLMMCTPDFQLT